jgi:bifunctional non-homologous end joining protein LigD
VCCFRSGAELEAALSMPIISRKIWTPKELFAGTAPRGDVQVKIGKDTFTFSSLGRVMFAKDGITKFDLMKYYYDVRTAILPYANDRPLTLRRFPTGISGLKFYQHDLEHAPKELTRKKIFAKTEGKEKQYAFANDIGDLLYLINIGCIGVHPYLCRYDALDKPDYVVFDLDPQPKASFSDVLEVALALKDTLDERKLKSYAKTSGAQGLHVYVPIKRAATFAQTSSFAKRIAEAVVRQHPKLATVTRTVSARKPQHVYIDYLQNLYGKSMAAPYCVRERNGATVSMPVTWTEVKKGFQIADFAIENARTRLKRRGDLFLPVLGGKQSIK